MVKKISRHDAPRWRTALPAAALTLFPAVATTPAAAQSAASFQTPEYFASGALNQINAAAAYAAGFTGKGVTVGVVDSGIDLRNFEFSTAGKFAGGVRFTTAFDATATDPSAYTVMPAGQNSDSDTTGSHGSIVSSLIAGARNGSGMHGSSFDASLYVAAINTNGSPPGAFDEQLSVAVTGLVDEGVKIINLSLGNNNCATGTNSAQNGGAKCNVDDYTPAAAVAELPKFAAAAQTAVANGALLIFATGNEKQPSPDILAGMPKVVSGIQNGWLAVGAVDANNVTTWYSNACGSAAAWCLVAPGDLTGATTVGTGNLAGSTLAGANGANYSSGSGTSYAAPTVAGVAALVKQAFSWFTNYDLQQTLLTTATALGTRTAGSITPDATYGWGLVNAGAAVKGYGAFVTTATLDTRGYSSTFGNDIFGPGGLIKTGAGKLTLSGNSTYTGPTTVQGGALAVTGSIVSQVTVEQGGIFGGSGQVGTTIVNGRLGLGTPQTLTINGDLTFGATGTYFASIHGATSDLVRVTGTAALDGTLKAQTLGGSYSFSTPYTLLSATGGVNGTFGSFDRSLVGAGLVTSVTYSGSQVQMTLTPGRLATLSENPTKAVTPTSTTTTSGGTTTVTTEVTTPTPANSEARTDRDKVAVAIDNAAAAGANMNPLFALYNSTDDMLDSELDQLTGEVHSSVQRMGVQVGGQFLGAMTDIHGEGRDPSANPALAYASMSRPAGVGAIDKATGATAGVRGYGPTYSVWGGPVTSYRTTSGDADVGSARSTSRATQFVSGIDIRFSPATMIGIAAAGGSASSSLAGGLGSASANVAQFGTYGTTRTGALTLTAAAAFSWMDVTTHRAIPVLGLTDVTGRYRPTVWSGRIEAAFEVARLARVAFSPYAAFDAHSMRTPGFSEQDAIAGGAAVGGLTVQGQTGTTTRSTLGLDTRGTMEFGGLAMQGFAKAGWAHYYAQAAQTTAFLTGIPGSDFTTTGAKSKPDAAAVSLGLTTWFTPSLSLTTTFDGEFAANSQAYTGAARVKLTF
ncbi:S8 family serine peptidase [uncultured Bradyrhizobium sp.]|mgnify:CR=1 FL=1|jgi:subtilase-type serine protease|uniref:S8 family serine peptidase n=1 Tax=uncultured Bradyrhizobium sp. TaxID=199684 RepID=UPI00260D7F09|nr:autotransporter serine protease [uncultured Bradyrhizobium sp.]